MKIFLENLYHSDCYFLPIRDNQQVLVGVELITHFSSEDGTVRIPTSRVIAQLTEEQHWQLFSEQLELLKSCQHFFIQHKLFAWLNLTPQVATLLLERDNYAGELLKYPFIELLINENYPHFNEGKDNRGLLSLSQVYPLVLGNLGAGNSTMKAVFDGLFTRVMLDKSQITHRSFEPFIRAIQAQISLVAIASSREALIRQKYWHRLPLRFPCSPGMPVACRSYKSDNDVGSAITLLFAGV